MYFLFHPISSLNHLVARIATDQIVLLISIFFFIILSLNYKKHFWKSIDERVALWSEESKENFIKARAEDFSIFGNAIFHIIFSVALSIVLFFIKHKFSIVFSVLFPLVFSWGLNRFMKLIYKRIRPENIPSNIRKRLSYCFPSGHVMASIPIYFFSAVILQNFITFLPWYLIAAAICYVIVITRIYLNHHYFTDVLAGIVMGIFCLNISIWFYFFVGLI